MAKTDEEYGFELIQNGLCLAEMPAFQGLLPKANAAGVPVYAVSDDEIGETGAVLEEMKEKRKYFSKLFNDFAAEVKRLTEQ